MISNDFVRLWIMEFVFDTKKKKLIMLELQNLIYTPISQVIARLCGRVSKLNKNC